MTTPQAILLGVMLVWTPAMLALAWMLSCPGSLEDRDGIDEMRERAGHEPLLRPDQRHRVLAPTVAINSVVAVALHHSAHVGRPADPISCDGRLADAECCAGSGH